jgi:multidrug efflux pump subunit AcrA (membrane-fusion protein)
VRIHLPEDSPLRIGMTTEVNIVVAEKTDTLLVPAAAVRRDQLFVIEGDRAAMREVVIGIRGDAFLEVLSGLDFDERLVLDSPMDLENGARIRIAGKDSLWAWLSTLR